MKSQPEHDVMSATRFQPSTMFVDFPLEDVETSIPERFEKIVNLCPDSIAIQSGKDALTYAELNARANQIARIILTRVVKKGTPIGLLVEKGADQVASMIGILKSGNIFVPIDSSLPRERIKAILDHSQSECLMTDKHNESTGRELVGDYRTLTVLDSERLSIRSDNVCLPIDPSDMAFIMYTSGSTGQPKGVPINHRQRLHQTMRKSHITDAHPGDRMALLTNGTASATGDIFRALLNGAGLICFDVKKEGGKRLIEWLYDERITVCKLASPLYRNICSLLPDRYALPELRILGLRSESVHTADVELFKTHFPPTCRLVIELSTTETGIICDFQIRPDTVIEGDEIPVGYPLKDVELLLLDEEGNEVGFNKIGEIVVRSKYLAPGYWNQPELTEAKFKSDPKDPEKRLFYTGDAGLRLPNGCLVHKGRKDFRVKIRGYGVDLNEVEQKLLSYPGLRQVVVVARQNNGGESYLVGYFTSEIQPPPNVSELRMFLKDKLADYMIPSAFIALEAIPLTANGKIDRSALPVPAPSRPQLEASYIAPQSFYEKKLVNIWEEVLNVHPIGVHDDFFDLGGQSLLGSKIIAQIEAAFQVDIPVGWLFESRTIAVFAKQMDALINKTANVSSEPFISLYCGDNDKQIFCFPHAGGFRNEYSRFVKLAQLIGGTYSFYGLRARGTDGKSQPFDCVEDMAREYVNTIQSIQPKGPYLLIAECGGAAEAYETARQLSISGDTIRLLAFFDGHLSYPSTLFSDTRRRLTGRLRYRLQDLRALRRFIIQGFASTAEQMRQLHGRQRVRHLLNKVRRIQSIKADANLVTSWKVNTDRKIINAQILRHLKRADEQHKQAALRYRHHWFRYWVPPFPGKLTLFVNEEWHGQNPTLGWERVKTRGIEVHKITGNHISYVTTHAEELAQKFKTSLEKATCEDDPKGLC